MTGSGGGSSSQTSTTSGPPPETMEAYKRLVNAASSTAQQPLRLYDAPIVAGFTPQQQQAFQTIQNAQGIGIPYINSAAQQYGAATTPLWDNLPKFSSDTLQQYLNPYTENVTSTLTDLYSDQNKRQFSQIAGNAAMNNAYGGDREIVAEALAAGEQQRAQAPVLAQVQQQGYQQAVGQFNDQQKQQLAADQANAWIGLQAGQGLAGLGAEAQSLALTGAQGLLGAGGLQQQLAQQQMNIPYQQFIQTQGYPYSQLGFLAPIVQGTGSLSGGRGTTTYPGPSTISQLAGLGTAGAGIYGLGKDAGWWGSGNGDFGGGGDDYGSWSASAKRGGRIGYAGGGGMPHLTTPEITGIGAGVPIIDLSYIPEAAPGGIPSAMGMGIGQQTTTTGGGGGGGGNDVFGQIVGAATKIIPFFLAHGGRVGFAEGGAADWKKPGIDIPGLPAIPKINLDYISHPGPAIKGSGPPKAPDVKQGGLDQGLDVKGIAAATKGLKESGLFGSKEEEGASASGGIGRYAGGGVPIAAAANFGGVPPNMQSAMQQLMEMPLSRLEQMAVQFPPTTPRGQMIARAIATKKAIVGSGTAPSAPAGGLAVPAGGLGAPQEQQQAPPVNYGGTSHTLAAGGSTGAGFVTEDELDPHPVVDHSAETVVVRYPSEGKVLDLGLPSFKGPRHLAPGGSAGARAFPRVVGTGYEWEIAPSSVAPVVDDLTPVRGPAKNQPLYGTGNRDPIRGTASPHFESMPTANGVAIPQLASTMFAPPTDVDPGGGIGDWFRPLDQYRPPGMSATGPGGSMLFPSTVAYVPAMAGIESALVPGRPIDVWAGGAGDPPAGAAAVPAETAEQQQITDFFANAFSAQNNDNAKRGGRAGFAGGGDVDEWGMEDYVPPSSIGERPEREEGIGTRKLLTEREIGDAVAAKEPVFREGEFRVRPSRAPDISPDTAAILAEHEKVDRPPFYSRGRSFGSLPIGEAVPNSPYAYALAPEIKPWGLSGNDVSGVSKHPFGGITLPSMGLGVKAESIEPPPAIVAPNDVSGIVDPMAGVGAGALVQPPAGLGMPPALAAPPSLRQEYDQRVARRREPNPVESFEDWSARMSDAPAVAAPAPAPTAMPQVHGAPSAPQIVPAGVTAPSGIGGMKGPVASAFAAEAQRQGLTEGLVLKAAQLESGMGTNLGSRGNVLQLGPSEWAQMGGGNMGDLATQARNGVAWLAKSRNEAQQALGREPQDWETYIVHQQGAAGGPALLKAPPGASAVDALAPAYGGNRATAMRAITGNGGHLGMTAGQFLDMTKARFEGYGGRLNLGATLAAGREGAAGPGGRGVGVESMSSEVRGIGTQAAGIGRSLAERAVRDRPDRAQQIREMWPLLAIAAGAGMMASRSPFPGVAIGEGLGAGVKAYETLRGLDTKQELATQRLQSASGMMDIRQQAVNQQGAHQEAQQRVNAERIALATQVAQANMEAKRAEIDAKLAGLAESARHHTATEAQAREAVALRKQLDDLRREQESGLTIPGVMKDGVPGTMIVDRKNPGDSSKHIFLPGGPKQTGAATAAEKAKMISDAIKADVLVSTDPAGALARALKSHGTTRQQYNEWMGIGTPAAPSPGASAAPAAAGPAPSQSVAPAMPAWAKQQAVGPGGKQIFSDGTAWFNPDHTPYAP